MSTSAQSATAKVNRNTKENPVQKLLMILLWACALTMGLLTANCSSNATSSVMPPPPQTSSGYQTVQYNGAPQSQRATLNFVSGGRAVVDDSGGATRIRLDDPTTMAFVKEDFLTGRICAAIVNNGSLGELGWNCDGLSMLFPPAVSGRPGIVRGSTGTTINTISRLSMGTPAPFVASENFDVLWIVNPLDADTNTRLRVGAGSDFSVDNPSDGAYFEKLPADTTWFRVCRSGGAETRTDTGSPVTTGTWHKLRVRRVDATTIGFTISAGLENVISSNCPSASGLQVGTQIKNTAAAEKRMEFDYAHLLITGLNR